MASGNLAVTGDPAADRLVNTEPLALLLAMMLDQQVTMEWAFMGPLRLQERLGGSLDAKSIAAMDPEDLEAAFKEKPALHRYPGSMAKRAQELSQHLVDNYDGEAGNVWKGVRNADVLFERMTAIPGYGEEKSKIFIAILAKRFDKQPAGWQEYAGPFADDSPRSVADIDGPESLDTVRQWKKAQKAKGKSKQD